MSYIVTRLHGRAGQTRSFGESAGWLGTVLAALPLFAAVFFLPSQGRAAEGKVIYENNFEKAEVGKVPEDFLVLDGAFTVKEEGGNKFLELPGAPLDTFGLLFGPTQGPGV